MSICARFTLYLLVTEATHWPSSWELVMRCCVVSAGRLRISTPGWHVNSPTAVPTQHLPLRHKQEFEPNPTIRGMKMETHLANGIQVC